MSLVEKLYTARHTGEGVTLTSDEVYELMRDESVCSGLSAKIYDELDLVSMFGDGLTPFHDSWTELVQKLKEENDIEKDYPHEH